MNLSETLSADFIEAQYRKYKSDPSSLPMTGNFFSRGLNWPGRSARPDRQTPTRSRPCARPGWGR
jgi:hypothetical protein